MYHILCIHVLVNDIWIVSFLAIMHDAAMNIYGQSILIQRVCICKFAYWLKFICNPKMWICYAQTCAEWQKIWITLCTHSQLRLNRPHSAFLFWLSWYKQGFFYDLFSAIYIYIYNFVLVCCFRWSPTTVLKVLSSVHKHSKVALCPTEKIQVLDKLSQAWVIGLLAEVQY